MTKFIFLAFSLTISAVAQGSSLKIIVVPAARKLNWSSNINLMSSFVKSQALAFKSNDFQDAARKTIGHVVAKIDCFSSVRWTSISIMPSRIVSQILRNGLEGMFLPDPHAYMQTEGEIKKFVVNNSKNAIVMKFPVDQETCNEMLKMDDAHRSQSVLWFGPLMNTYLQYNSATQMGGSGSTYAVALKQLEGSSNVDLRRWLEIVQLPGSGEMKSFYSVQSMWDYAHSEIIAFPSRKYVEGIIYKSKKAHLNGIEF